MASSPGIRADTCPKILSQCPSMARMLHEVATLSRSATKSSMNPPTKPMTRSSWSFLSQFKTLNLTRNRFG